ncbi:murein biosynthesis integral membrane protein MurJ [Desulforhopalus singaporensis]|uniref:Probable lipid II flippase MurJ n=1 Tax=Desulforhopalus singaporensis TaxID=91360 RepID=A0A1H0PUP0_9BACT|nr:murein biosynthesis integral membrane protein MurJ [Desulforhopalus singaporensis]SDP08871.1 putative peptidoglycan lipid II flippase [Desulforhopalus singaporensis]
MLKQTETKKTIAGSAAAVGVAVMCSRVLGLIREQVFAGLFGAGFTYDSFVVAFRIPNLLRDLFGEGALSAAFVTVFSDYDATRTREETYRLASNVLTFILVLLSLLTLGGIYFAKDIVMLLAPDFDLVAGKVELTRQLTRIMLPFLVLISLSAVVMGILNTRGRFFIPALASSFFNLGSIIGGTSLAMLLPRYGQPAIVGMAVGTLIGGLLQLCVQLPTLWKTGFRYRFGLNLRDAGLHRILKLMIPATVGLSATQINIFINTNFAASCAEGSVSWLYYSFRLVQLPIGLFGVALSIAMLPVLAKQAAQKEVIKMKETMISSLTMVFALTLPATAGLIILAEPIIRLIFEHGAFTATDTIQTAQTLALFAIGLFAYSANKVLVPAFYALDKTRYPVIASFLAIGFNLVIVTLTINRLGHLAIALSTSCTMLINFIFLMGVLYVSMGGYSVRYLLKGLGKIVTSTLFLCLVLVALLPLASPWLAGNLIEQAVALFFLIFTAAIGYGLVLQLMRLPELDVIVRRVFAKIIPAKR